MMSDKEITLKQIYDEIIKNRCELKQQIDASETKLLMKIEGLRNKVNSLEKENLFLRKELEDLNRENKKNAIVIFGLTQTEEILTTPIICRDISRLLEVELEANDLNDFYRLGKDISSPLKVIFTTYWKKKQILKNCYKLKGKNISIGDDLTLEQRKEQRILRKHRKLAKQDKRSAYIKGNKLYVDNVAYTTEDLLEEDTSNCLRNSAPPTPISTRPEGINETENIANSTEEPPNSKIETPVTKLQKKSSTRNQGYRTRIN